MDFHFLFFPKKAQYVFGKKETEEIKLLSASYKSLQYAKQLMSYGRGGAIVQGQGMS